MIGSTIPAMERLYLGSTRLLSGLLVVLGLVLIGSAIARGGGPAALGVLVGIGMTLAGLARLWLLRGFRGNSR
jgi:hypothetical protein